MLKCTKKDLGLQVFRLPIQFMCFWEKVIKEYYLGLHDIKDINLLEEIPPQDRQFVLDFYKLYKQKK